MELNTSSKNIQSFCLLFDLFYIYLGPGLFHEIIEKAKNMTPDERAELLESNEKLASVHKDAGDEGQTRVMYHLLYLIYIYKHMIELIFIPINI